MSTSNDRLRDNLAEIRDRIEQAAASAGRNANEIRLIAVSKYVEAPTIEQLMSLGCLDLGESRPQSLWAKHDELASHQPPPKWHFIGHLQRNKVKRTLGCEPLIHSVDSVRLLKEINEEAGRQSLTCKILLEVNVSGDIAKHGFRPEELAAALRQAAELPHVRVCGLMGMAAREGGLDAARKNFGELRELRDQLRDDQPPTISLDELSMGMSNDFEAAICEGATMIRVGSAFYEGVTT